MRLDRTHPIAASLRRAGPLRRLRGWNSLLYALFHPGTQTGVRFEVPFGNGLHYPGRADELVDWTTYFYGAYEADLLRMLVQAAERVAGGCVFLDVGANTGHHTLFMAPHCAAIHAVEPNPGLWPRIEEKLQRNQLQNVTLHRVALGEVDGTLPFFLPAVGNPGTGSLVGGDEANRSETIPVPVRRGDDLLAAAGIAHVDLVKLDVEGFEPQALRGLRRTLEASRPLVVLEINDGNRQVFGSLAALHAHLPAGYELFHQQRAFWPLNWLVERPLNERALARIHGNVIARPRD
jgi:FkbM family methyltransferase